MPIDPSIRCAALLLLGALAACDDTPADDPDAASAADAALPDSAPEDTPDSAPEDTPDGAAPDRGPPPALGALVFAGPVYYLAPLDGMPSTLVNVVGVNYTPEPMTIDSITLDGDPGFTVAPGAFDDAIDADFLADPDHDDAPGLAPAGRLWLEVTYTADDDAPARTRLRVIADGEPFDVTIIANRRAPCVRTEPRALDFGRTLVNQTDERPLLIRSCGFAPARITALSIRGDEAFGLAEPGPPLPFGLPEIGAERGLDVTFRAADPGDYAAELVIESDDAEYPTQTVPLRATAIIIECPVAAVAESEIAVAVGDAALLDGRPSSDPQARDGEPVDWSWSISARPDGSAAEVVESAASGEPDDIGTPTAELVPDVAGRYVIDLQVRNFIGLTAPGGPQCDPTPVQIVIDAAAP